jgi:membrane associated rhomboid family serine protease/Flp pilus assembly protein TadD
MLPLKDDAPCNSITAVNTLIIALNCLVMGYEQLLPMDALKSFITTWGVVPERFLTGFSLQQMATQFSSMFMHGGWAHLIGNMWFLYLFGDNVEDRFGSTKYLIFYMACGLISGYAQIFSDQQTSLPCIGASGAIAGVLGAYFVLFPTAKVLTMAYTFIWVWVPAYVFIGAWFILQIILNVLTVESGHAQSGGVAWMAHIGGFIFGASVAKLLILGDKVKNAEDFAQQEAEANSWLAWMFVALPALGMALVGMVSYATIHSFSLGAYLEYAQGDKAMQDHNWIDASKHFSQSIVRAPQSGPCYKGRALAEFNNSDYKDAISDFQSVIKYEPNDPDARNYLAEAYWKLGNYSNSMVAYSEQEKHNPNDIAAINGLAWGYLQLGNLTTAEQDFKRALAIDPRSTKATAGIAAVLYKEKKYKEAIAACQKTIANDPTASEANGYAGLSYLALGRYDEGVDEMDRAIRLEPNNVQFLVTRADLYVKKKQFLDALIDLTKAVNLDPKNQDARNKRNALLAQTKQPKPKARPLGKPRVGAHHH